VAAARAAAAARLAGTGPALNSQVPGRLLRERWPVPRPALALAERALDSGLLSVRGLDRVLRVTWISS
jgi:magnesium chelatase family protein